MHKNEYKCSVLVVKSKRKMSLGRPKLRWEDNMKMDLKEIEQEDVNCIHLAQDRDQWWAFVEGLISVVFVS
jgi:hypothetical protein